MHEDLPPLVTSITAQYSESDLDTVYSDTVSTLDTITGNITISNVLESNTSVIFKLVTSIGLYNYSSDPYIVNLTTLAVGNSVIVFQTLLHFACFPVASSSQN